MATTALAKQLRNLKLQFFVQDHALVTLPPIFQFVNTCFQRATRDPEDADARAPPPTEMTKDLWERKLHTIMKEHYFNHRRIYGEQPAALFPRYKLSFQKLVELVYFPFINVKKDPLTRWYNDRKNVRGLMNTHFSKMERKAIDGDVWQVLNSYPKSLNPTQLLYSASLWELQTERKWPLPEDRYLVLTDYAKPSRLKLPVSPSSKTFESIYSFDYQVSHNRKLLSSRVRPDTEFKYIVTAATKSTGNSDRTLSHKILKQIASLDNFKVIEINKDMKSSVEDRIDDYVDYLQDVELHFDQLLLAYKDIVDQDILYVQNESELFTLLSVMTSIFDSSGSDGEAK